MLNYTSPCPSYGIRCNTKLSGCQIFVLYADSHDLRLTRAAAADGCVSAEIVIFLFFYTAHFCRNRKHKTQLV